MLLVGSNSPVFGPKREIPGTARQDQVDLHMKYSSVLIWACINLGW
jgi:hypothetical protein